MLFVLSFVLSNQSLQFYLQIGKKTAIISHFEIWGVKKTDRSLNRKLSSSFSSNKVLAERFGRIKLNTIVF